MDYNVIASGKGSEMRNIFLTKKYSVHISLHLRRSRIAGTTW